MARIAGVDLPKEKRVEIGLTYVYGIGRKSANDILAKAGVNPDTRVKDLSEAEIGKIYRGLVKTVRDFGAFVEILPGQDGLLHISEMANYRVKDVSDICKEGDYVTVKVIDIDRTGKVRLSRKAALEDLDREEAKK